MPVTFEGKVISCGRQEGKLFWLPDPPVRVAVLKTEFVDAEVIHFKTVLSAAKEKLEKWYAMAVKEFGEKAADIFDMQLSILYDECSLTDSVVELIDTEHMSAEKVCDKTVINGIVRIESSVETATHLAESSFSRSNFAANKTVSPATGAAA